MNPKKINLLESRISKLENKVKELDELYSDIFEIIHRWCKCKKVYLSLGPIGWRYKCIDCGKKYNLDTAKGKILVKYDVVKKTNVEVEIK